VFPSCGATFDFQVGETLHVTTIAQTPADDPKAACRSSEVRIDSPQRFSAVATANPTIGFVNNPVLFSDNVVNAGSCSGHRLFSVVPLGGFPGAPGGPTPGQVPPLVAVRSATLFAPDAGACGDGFPAPGVCADQFVVRVSRE